MRLSFGLVDTWHSKTPASSGVTNRTFRVFEFGLQHLLLQIATYTFSNCNIYFFKLQHLLFQNKFLPWLHSGPFHPDWGGGGGGGGGRGRGGTGGGQWIVAKKWKIERPLRPGCLFDRSLPIAKKRTDFPWAELVFPEVFLTKISQTQWFIAQHWTRQQCREDGWMDGRAVDVAAKTCATGFCCSVFATLLPQLYHHITIVGRKKHQKINW